MFLAGLTIVWGNAASFCQEKTGPPIASDTPQVNLDQNIRLSPDAAAEHLQQKDRPEYPSKALDRQQEGDVALDVLIGKNGKVKNVKVERGDAILAQAAVDSVRHWALFPIYVRGEER